MFRKSHLFASSAAIVLFVTYFAGCNREGTKDGPKDAATSVHKEHGRAAHTDHGDSEGHGHKPGQHGGTIVSLGSDSYHVEAVFETGGVLRLYMLGNDETRIQEVEAQTLKAYGKAEGSSESVSFEVKPEPQEGDAEGKTSRFVAELPEALRGKPVSVTVPSIRVGGERFRLGFTSADDSHAANDLPAKLPESEEAKLFLTAGGIYTEADIEANGNVTGSEKFKGFQASHDLKPKTGDKICPITLTKANPEVTWVVGGKKYEFCCPPCVGEFVGLAKENPTEIKDPDQYVKN